MTLFFIKTIYKLFIWLNVLCCLVKQRLIIIMNYNEYVFHEMFKLNNRMSLSAKSFFLLDQLLKLIKTFLLKWVCSWYVAAGSKTGDVFISIHEFVVTNNRPPWFESIPYTCWRHLKFSIQTLLEELFCMTTLNLVCPKNIYHGSKLLILNKQDLRDLRSVNHWRLKGLEIHCIFGQM